MFCNTIGARKMLGHLYDIHSKPAPADYPYESDSDSTGSDVPSPKAPRRVVKKKTPPMRELPQPSPPPIKIQVPAAGAHVGAMPGGTLPPKVKKPRAKKAAAEPAAEPKGAPLATPAPVTKSEPEAEKPVTKATKTKRAPSAYNKFVSEKMKAGKSMKEVAELWKEAKGKSS